MSSFFKKFQTHRIFVLFLAIALGLWYFNKLSYRYTTEVPVTFEFTTDYNSDVWVENPDFEIACLVDGVGRNLIKYQTGVASRFKIPLSQISFRPTTSRDPYMFEIDETSLMRAIAALQNDIAIVQIYDTLPWVKVSQTSTAMIPVKSNIEIGCKKQFMQVGQTKIEPQKVELRAAWAVLDTLQYIETESLMLEDLDHSVSGSIGLRLPHGVISQLPTVRYTADITGYTEMNFKLPVVIDNLPDSLTYSLTPILVNVVIKIPLRSYTRSYDRVPIASIDYRQRDHLLGTLFRVTIDSLPEEVVIKSIKPEFVEPFFQIRKP